MTAIRSVLSDEGKLLFVQGSSDTTDTVRADSPIAASQSLGEAGFQPSQLMTIDLGDLAPKVCLAMPDVDSTASSQ